MSEGQNSQANRREFLRKLAAGAAASLGAAAGLPRVFAASGKPPAPQMRYRTLGRTGLKVSELGMGDGTVPMVHRALDLGLNYFDTAPSYGEGRHEEMLGRALKGRRAKAIVASKWYDGTVEELVGQVEASLKRLQSDYVDIVQIHGAGDPEQVNSEPRWEAFQRLKKAGKVRFNGLTCHPESISVVEAAVKSGRYDTVFSFYSLLTAGQTGAALHAAAKANLGVIVMKVLQPAQEGKGGEALMNLRGNAHQKALQWALLDRSVSTAVVGMTDFDQMATAMAAVRAPMTLEEQVEFEAAVERLAMGTCHLCGTCTGRCPAGVQVADVMRCLLYADGHRDIAEARSTYRALPADAAACQGCGACEAGCPWQVPVRARLERAHGLLA